jgi:hypothetical protein
MADLSETNSKEPPGNILNKGGIIEEARKFHRGVVGVRPDRSDGR